MDGVILQSALAELSHLVIPLSRVFISNVKIGAGGYGEAFLAMRNLPLDGSNMAAKRLGIGQEAEVSVV